MILVGMFLRHIDISISITLSSCCWFPSCTLSAILISMLVNQIWPLHVALQAEKVDAALHSLLMKLEPQRQHLACLGTWILYHNLRIMIQYLLSGFELELYSMHEYYYIYW